MPKNDGAHRIILHPKFERKRISGRYFIALWFFNKVVWFVLAATLEGILLPSNLAAKNYFLLLSCKMFDSYAQMCWKCFHVIFSTISLKFKCKISVLKEVIHSFKNQFGHVTSCELTHFKKMVQVRKTKSQLFCLKYDPLMVFWSQNHITFFA